MITHYDLFAGIGGFSLALEEVFDEPIRHVFCEWESFPTAVLRQHWPDGEFWGDIADLVADTNERPSGPRIVAEPDEAEELERSTTRSILGDATHTEHARLEGGKQDQTKRHGGLTDRERSDQAQDWTIVTGGFPCQPFSHAGRRKGTADDRYKWPEMFAVIKNVKPEWVIAENVRGLVTWSEGLVLETVCSDLEAEGYEVQPLIIPAVAVNAPHRRDRVWIIAHRNSERSTTGSSEVQEADGEVPERNDHAKLVYPDWSRDWREVAFATCDGSVDDGLPRLVDGVPYSRAKWRKDSLKAYGNGIVPQVAMEIMKAIKLTAPTGDKR